MLSTVRSKRGEAGAGPGAGRSAFEPGVRDDRRACQERYGERNRGSSHGERPVENSVETEEKPANGGSPAAISIHFGNTVPRRSVIPTAAERAVSCYSWLVGFLKSLYLEISAMRFEQQISACLKSIAILGGRCCLFASGRPVFASGQAPAAQAPAPHLRRLSRRPWRSRGRELQISVGRGGADGAREQPRDPRRAVESADAGAGCRADARRTMRRSCSRTRRRTATATRRRTS